MAARGTLPHDGILLQEESKDELIEEILRLRERLKKVEQENEELKGKLEKL